MNLFAIFKLHSGASSILNTFCGFTCCQKMGKTVQQDFPIFQTCSMLHQQRCSTTIKTQARNEQIYLLQNGVKKSKPIPLALRSFFHRYKQLIPIAVSTYLAGHVTMKMSQVGGRREESSRAVGIKYLPTLAVPSQAHNTHPHLSSPGTLLPHNGLFEFIKLPYYISGSILSDLTRVAACAVLQTRITIITSVW